MPTSSVNLCPCSTVLFLLYKAWPPCATRPAITCPGPAPPARPVPSRPCPHLRAPCDEAIAQSLPWLIPNGLHRLIAHGLSLLIAQGLSLLIAHGHSRLFALTDNQCKIMCRKVSFPKANRSYHGSCVARGLRNLCSRIFCHKCPGDVPCIPISVCRTNSEALTW